MFTINESELLTRIGAPLTPVEPRGHRCQTPEPERVWQCPFCYRWNPMSETRCRCRAYRPGDAPEVPPVELDAGQCETPEQEPNDFAELAAYADGEPAPRGDVVFWGSLGVLVGLVVLAIWKG